MDGCRGGHLGLGGSLEGGLLVQLEELFPQSIYTQSIYTQPIYSGPFILN